MKCIACGDYFVKAKFNQKYCSKKCKGIYHGATSDHPGVGAGTSGAISELIAAADLLHRGYEVFRALSPHASCDLAILKDGNLIRVEVRTGRRHVVTGRLYFPKTAKDAAQYAVVVNGRDVCYFPPLPK